MTPGELEGKRTLRPLPNPSVRALGVRDQLLHNMEGKGVGGTEFAVPNEPPSKKMCKQKMESAS